MLFETTFMIACLECYKGKFGLQNPHWKGWSVASNSGFAFQILSRSFGENLSPKLQDKIQSGLGSARLGGVSNPSMDPWLHSAMPFYDSPKFSRGFLRKHSNASRLSYKREI